MFILNSSQRKVEQASSEYTAIAVLRYDNNKDMALFSSNTNLEENILLGNPTWKGHYYQITTPSTIAYGIVDGVAWSYDNVLHWYSVEDSIEESIELTLRWVASTDPIVLNIGANFTVNKIEIEGLKFTLGSNPGQFQQQDNNLFLFQNSTYSITPGQNIFITGNLEIIAKPIATVARFFLPEVDFPDQVAWFGKQFHRAINNRNLKVYNYEWDDNAHLLTLLLEPQTRLPEILDYEPQRKIQSISSQNYFSA